MGIREGAVDSRESRVVSPTGYVESGFSRTMTGVAFLTLVISSVGYAQPPREFKWAGDPEGGAPFVEADKDNNGIRVRGTDEQITLELRAERAAREESDPGRWYGVLPAELGIAVMRPGEHEEPR